MRKKGFDYASRRQPEYVPADVLVTEARAAELLAVNGRTLAQWRLRRVGPPYVKISSRCVRYRLRDIAVWADERTRSATAEP